MRNCGSLRRDELCGELVALDVCDWGDFMLWREWLRRSGTLDYGCESGMNEKQWRQEPDTTALIELGMKLFTFVVCLPTSLPPHDECDRILPPARLLHSIIMEGCNETV
jgi:hypothetical protein